jgi:hypothetical protein
MIERTSKRIRLKKLKKLSKQWYRNNELIIIAHTMVDIYYSKQMSENK